VKTSPPASAKVLEKVLSRESSGQLTVADAAARAGLPLRDAEEGLRYLAAEFSGHLAATEKGEILYSFPGGLQRPPETRLLRRMGRAVIKTALGIGRFVVRAWVSVVVVGYALVFLALLLALALRSDSDRDGPGEALGVVFRIIVEALFWTFHPFSPMYLSREPGWMHQSGRRHKKVAFYEKVNRFVFGPPKPERDKLEEERKVLAEIRAQKGRVSPADVMRVTGLVRDEAERLLLRLMVDYQGDLEVADSGAIIYKFKDLRMTAREQSLATATRPQPAWLERLQVMPLTGNAAGSNVFFVLLNTFNLGASGYVLANGLTLERLTFLLTQVTDREGERVPLPPADGIPLVLGAIPFAFSAALFLFPLLRALKQPGEKARVARENGWRGVLQLVLTGRGGRVAIPQADVAAAFKVAAGKEPTEKELLDAVRAAGGEADLDAEGRLVYKFDTVESELQAAEADRRAASGEEARPGAVVFDSAAEGKGWEDERPVRSPSDRRFTPPGTPERPALSEVPDTIPDPQSRRPESAEELLARLGVDTRRRGR
jgi:hypothetical protein